MVTAHDISVRVNVAFVRRWLIPDQVYRLMMERLGVPESATPEGLEAWEEKIEMILIREPSFRYYAIKIGDVVREMGGF